jgi:outer membrane immunogenic protein
MLKHMIAAALAAGLVAAPALADPAGPPAPASGFRVEALAGYDTSVFPGLLKDPEGILYGVGVGYDFALGNKVRLGLEGEASDSTGRSCLSSLIAVGDRLCTESGRDLYAGARLGLLTGKSTLLYIKAGYTNYRLSTEYDPGPSPSTIGLSSGAGNADGLRAGVGAEFALGRRAFVKAEYRYSQYENDFDRHQGVIGLGLRF